MNGASQIRLIKFCSWPQNIFTLCLICLSLLTHAQDSLKLYRSGFGACEDFIRKGKMDKAIACYEELSLQFPQQIKNYIRLAEINYSKQDKIKTLFYANKAADINAQEAFAPLTYLAIKMNEQQDDDLAIKIMNRLSVSNLDSASKAKTAQHKLNFTLRSYADKTPVAGISLKNLGDSINTAENEYLPSISLDGQTMVFTRNVGGNEDFFISQKDSNGKWQKAKNLGYPPNTGLPDGAAMLSADGNYLFYSRCDLRSPNGIEKGGCDLAFSYRENDTWSSPQYFGLTINTTGYEGQPCLSSDNKDLYFVSNRAGGFGGQDIWVSHFIQNYWSAPENLGPSINTPKDESSPFIHPDNETLYFSSDGHPGIGKTDLFVSRKNSNDTWKKPLNLGAPINTENHDGSIIVNAKGTIGYCASDRGNGKGGLDIYSFELHPAIKPNSTLCIKGFVQDKFYKKNIRNLDIEWTDLSNKKVIASIKSNAGDGSFTQALQIGNSYMAHIEEEGYRPYYKKINLRTDEFPDNVALNFRLKQPGFIDTLFSCFLHMDSTHVRLEDSSTKMIDSIMSIWPTWKEDSSTITIFAKGFYYCCDSLSDTLYKQRLDACQTKLNLLEDIFAKHKITCLSFMQDLDMIIYNDEEELFDKIEITVIENY